MTTDPRRFKDGLYAQFARIGHAVSTPNRIELLDLLAQAERRIREGNVTVIDVRPRAEYVAAHIPGALSIPIDQLKRGRAEVPKSREVVAYCRGRYCVYAVEAVTLLRKRGYRARRLVDGLPGWRGAGHRIEEAS